MSAYGVTSALAEIIQRVRAERQRLAANPDSDLVKLLCSKGLEIIEAAYASKETKDDRYNQRDAYGYAVYYEGMEVTRGYLDGEWSNGPARINKASDVGGKTGRQEVDEWLSSFVPPSLPRTYHLVVVNAMWYSEMQEAGTAPLRGSYKILSQLFYKLDELAVEARTMFGATLTQE